MRDLKTVKRAAISVELGLTIVLVSALLIVSLGMFNDNFRNMIIAGNFRKVFTNAKENTTFKIFNRDYSDSQVEVQITGEQGLEALRMKINNKEMELLAAAGKSENTLSVNEVNVIMFYENVIKLLAVGDNGNF